MRPYLALIADSFLAAFASRILWIALLLIGGLLAALAPLGYREVFTTQFTSGELLAPERLIAELAEGLDQPQAETPPARIARALPQPLQQRIQQAVADAAKPPRREELVKAFNDLLNRDDAWYDRTAWSSTTRLSELRKLDETPDDQLDDLLRQRRARLRLEAGLPGVFRPRPDKSITITYAHLETPVTLPMRQQQFAGLLNEYVLPLILDWVLGIVGVLLGILVTASIIPDTLQPGSLHLLLSKPVSRWMLYLSKFAGGCAFVVLCVAPLVIGLWLIAGLRLGVWNWRLLLCIPVLVFLFAVYYSISALAALRWRSAIVSMVVTLMFWLGFGLIGQAGALFDELVKKPAQVSQLAIVAGGGDAASPIIAANRNGDLLLLRQSSDQWQVLSAAQFGGGDRVLGPVVLADQRVVATRIRGGALSPFGAGAAELILLAASRDWESTAGLELPGGAAALLPGPDGGLLVSAASGVYSVASQHLQASDDQRLQGAGLSGGIFAPLQQWLGSRSSQLVSVLPPTLDAPWPREVAMRPGTDQLLVYSRGQLTRLEQRAADQPWQIAAQHRIAEDIVGRPTLVVCQTAAMLISEKGLLRMFDVGSLQPTGQLTLPDDVTVVQAAGSPVSGHASLVLSDGRLMRVDARTGETRFPELPGQGEIEAASYAPNGTLVAAYDVDSVVGVAPDGGVAFHFSPTLPFWRKVDRYLVDPLRLVVPQTGELRREAIAAIVAGQTTRSLGEGELADHTRQKLDVTRPLVTCGLFIAVMLAIGCVYISRQDF